MALYDVTAEPICRPHGAFEVYGGVGFELAEGGSIPRLLAHVEAHLALGEVGDRKASSVDRDAFAFGERV